MATKPRISGAPVDEQAADPADDAADESVTTTETGDDPVDPVPADPADDAADGDGADADASEAGNPFSTLIGGETIVRMVHPGGGTSDRFAREGDAILVPAAEVPEMRDHGFVIDLPEA